MTVSRFLAFCSDIRRGIDADHFQALRTRFELTGDLLGAEGSNTCPTETGKRSASFRLFFTVPNWSYLDEPTNGLDPLMQEAFYGLLREGRRLGGDRLFLLRTNLAEVEKVCDRVAIIRSGRIIACRNPGRTQAEAVSPSGLTLHDPALKITLFPGPGRFSVRETAAYI